METKQTAVEWIVEEMILRLGIRIKNTIDGVELLKEAKAMEKEKISNAYFQGLIDGMNNSPKQYYEETYNKQDNGI